MVILTLFALVVVFFLFGFSLIDENSSYYVLSYLIFIPIIWLYFAIQESSSSQATIGKRVVNIKVMDIEGNRIGFGKATLRTFVKFFPIIGPIGCLAIAFSENKQGLHDWAAKTFVLYSKYMAESKAESTEKELKEIVETPSTYTESKPEQIKSNNSEESRLNVMDDFIRMLKSTDENERFRGAMKLGESKDPKAYDPLVMALKDPSSEIRWRAALSLGELGDKRAIVPLKSLISDNDPRVREVLSESFGMLGDLNSIEYLMNDNVERVRNEASENAVKYGGIAGFRVLVRALGGTNENAYLSASWLISVGFKKYSLNMTKRSSEYN